MCARTIKAALQIGISVLGTTLAPATTLPLEPGSQTRPPVAASAAVPRRQALVVAPAPAGGAMAADAETYAGLLRLLGFRVATVVAETRPELEHGLRQFAEEVQPGSEVAIFALGTVPAHGEGFYLTARPAPSDSAARPETLATEGVAFADLLRRIGDHGPKDVVAIVDGCRPAQAGDDCRLATSALPAGVSALVTSRRRGGGDGAPLARLASLRPELLPLMHQADLSFFALYAALRGRLAETDTSLSATPSLTRNFAFLPGDFLAKLPITCNQVDGTGDPSALRGRRLEEQASSCAEAARTYDFSPFFARKLRIVREQLAYQRTSAAGCDAVSAAEFLRTYPDGPLSPAIEASRTECELARRDADVRAAVQRAAQQEQAARESAALEEARRERLAKEEAQARQPPLQAAPASNASRMCASFMGSYFKQWSLPNAAALGFIDGAYAPTVNYYGKNIGRSEVLREKSNFALRWPDRDYSVKDGTFSVVGDVCRITGVVRWRAARPSGKASQGLAEFDLTVALGASPRITAENGKILSRSP